ncbi:MAG: hypothetical protein IPM64_07080 [Phycisphaerales bacterium]|nr:hypothetical protein [Phycisphaerales bacterium]
MPLVFNELAGWVSVLLGMVSGALLGLRFHRPEFLGGYGSLPRRMIRLGHIALLALGMLNVLFVQSVPRLTLSAQELSIAQWCFLLGNIAMPTCCGLTAWRVGMRHLFVLPVALLIGGVYSVCAGLLRGL